MQKHIQMLGIIYVVYHAIGLIFAWFVWGLLSGIGVLSGDPQAAGILTLIGTVVATLMIALSAPGVVAGIGILKGWWWARYLVLFLGILNLVNVPLGTLLGVYSFWVMMQDETIEYFDSDRGMVAYPPQGSA